MAAPIVLKTRTPIEIRPFVDRLVVAIGTADPPVFVPVRPAPGAEINDCFPNVSRQVEREGGILIVGWSIAEWPDVMAEAEFHGIWKSPAGELIDVTPNVRREDRTLFAPDTVRIYEHRIVNNVRLPLSNSRDLAELIAIREEQFGIKARYESPGGGEFRIPIEVAQYLQEREKRARLLVARIRPEYPGRNDPCSCGSGAKFKKCCGRG